MLYLVGLGLSRDHIPIGALNIIKNSDRIILDTYTSYVSDDVLEYLRSVSGHCIRHADRRLLEEKQEEVIKYAKDEDVTILVPGDPLIATTHVTLVLNAIRMGIKVKVVNAASIISVAPGATGLQAYKFGRTITLPKSADLNVTKTTYYEIAENMSRGLHTLILLDTADGGLTIREALDMLIKVENTELKNVITRDRLTIGLAKLGTGESHVFAGPLHEVIEHRFPPPPHSIIFPGKLHFVEKEALEKICGAKRDALESHKLTNPHVQRILKYIENVGKVLSSMRRTPKVINNSIYEQVLDHAKNYFEDSKYFLNAGDHFSALTAIAYCEGILDSLRMLKEVEFRWPGERR